MSEAIIRPKDAAGLEEWCARRWVHFPSPPSIADVTESMGALFAALAADWRVPGTEAGVHPVQLRDCAVVLCVGPAGSAEVALRARGAPALAAEVADLSKHFGDVFAYVQWQGASAVLTRGLPPPRAPRGTRGAVRRVP